MRFGKLCLQTTRETPADVKIASHSLLVRGGFVKSLANGIFSHTAPARLAILNIERIIREEMNNIDGQECRFPVVMPKELWESSGRYTSIGSEMARFKDRNGKDMLLGMTHEEAAVHLAKSFVGSYQSLPFMIYQIQTKFRDEPRPRGGLIRLREFTMKDAYSFHMTQEDLVEYYDKAYEAYHRVFKRAGMKNFIAVKSDMGMMGGDRADEFMLISPIGEDTLVLCDHCGYKANMEVASSVYDKQAPQLPLPLAEVFTGDAKEIQCVCDMLKVTPDCTIKAVVYAVKGEQGTVIVFLRGDREVNEAKLRAVLGKNIVAWENDGESGIAAGNIGIKDLRAKNNTVVYDISIANTVNMVTGANKPEYHLVNFCIDRDLPDSRSIKYVDVSKVKEGEACPVCGQPLKLVNGIEIGNIFQLGTKYTKSMNMTVLNERGELVNPIMGCYGIGVDRMLASIIEENHDDKGIIFPVTVAPFKVHICGLRMDDPQTKETAEMLYKELESNGISTLFDDRDLSAGVKFADADLLGMPIRMVVSPKGLKDGCVELKLRKESQSERVPVEAVLERVNALIKELSAEYYY
ncbi:MAG: proline--tRNA ligase [Clostridia bacterium]|nr:proline--tRNA ligase [Clostridia bacterium]